MKIGMSPCEASRWASQWAESGRLLPRELRVLKELALHVVGPPVAWPSNARLAAQTGQSEDTVKAALDGLEEKGLLERARDDAGQVRRSREHPIVLRVDRDAFPPAQMQLDLGSAIVAPDPQPRRRPVPVERPADELAERRRRFAEQAAALGAQAAALNQGAEPATPPRGAESPTEVREKSKVQTEGERERASAPASPHQDSVENSTVLAPTLTVVADVLRHGFSPAVVDAMLPSIDSALRAYPEPAGHQHEQAAWVVVAWQREGDMRSGSPARLLMSALRKQLEPRTPSRAPASRRRGDLGHQPSKPKTGRFTKRSSVEDATF